MDEQGTPGKAQTQRGSVQEAKAGTGDPAGAQRHCLRVQKHSEEGQAYVKLNLVGDVKSNKKDFSRYIGSKRHTRENLACC